MISRGKERRRRPFLRRSVSLCPPGAAAGARGGGVPGSSGARRAGSTASPGAHPCGSPHLRDVSEIAIALTHPWLALATTTAKASPDRCGGQIPPAGLARLTGQSIKAQGMGRVSSAGSSSALLFRPEGALRIPNSHGKAGASSARSRSGSFYGQGWRLPWAVRGRDLLRSERRKRR